MIENYIRKRESLVCLFVLVDSSVKPQAIDLDFIYKLVKWKINFAVIFTKTDKNKPVITEKNAESFLESLTGSSIEELNYFNVSALHQTGRIPLLDYISTVISNFTHKF